MTDKEIARRRKLWDDWRCRKCGKTANHIFRAVGWRTNGRIEGFMIRFDPHGRTRPLVQISRYLPPLKSVPFGGWQGGYYCRGCRLYLGNGMRELFETLAGLLTREEALTLYDVKEQDPQ